MKKIRNIALSIMLFTPAFSLAQGARGGGPMGQTGLAQGMQRILDQLDLTDDQKIKTDEITKQTQMDVRDAMQGMQDVDPQERRAKLQEVQKMMVEGKDKIEAVLTPEQKKKFYPLNANMLLKRATDTIAAMKTAGAKIEIDDSVRTQLNAILSDTGKTLDGYQSDADGISSPAAETNFQQKLLKTQVDLVKQLRDTLGAEDAQHLTQSARQAAVNGGGGRTFTRKPLAASKPTPSTQP